MTIEEKKNLSNTFKALDINGDGKLTKSEILAVYNRYSFLQEWEITKMLTDLNIIQDSQEIDYSSKNVFLPNRIHDDCWS